MLVPIGKCPLVASGLPIITQIREDNISGLAAEIELTEKAQKDVDEDEEPDRHKQETMLAEDVGG